jgi:hypothetical protein
MTAAGDETGIAIDWRVVLRASLVGLAVVAPVSVLNAVLDHEIADYDNSGWRYPLFVLILVGYAAAGWVAARAKPASPLSHAALAGMGTIVLWIPIRIVIWAVREDGRGLVTGDRAALPPGQLFGHVVIAAALAMFGALLAMRLGKRRALPA